MADGCSALLVIIHLPLMFVALGSSCYKTCSSSVLLPICHSQNHLFSVLGRHQHLNAIYSFD